MPQLFQRHHIKISNGSHFISILVIFWPTRGPLGPFPDALKIAKVIPLHKGGCTLDLNNFRPISLLSIFHKIFEKIMHKKLYNFLIIHDILFANQFG